MTSTPIFIHIENDHGIRWGAWILTVLLAAPAAAVLTVKPINDFITAGFTIGRWIGKAGNAVTIPAGTAGLTDVQRSNAQIIIEEGLKLGASQRDLEVAIAAAMQECQLENCDYGDRDSLGLFQQRPSQDWGSEAEIMNPHYAAQAFFKGAGTNPGLLNISDRSSMSLTQAAQAVQRSEFPNKYANHEAVAKEVVAAALANRVPGAVGGKTVPLKGVVVTSAKDASGEPGLDYVVSDGQRGAEFGALAAGEVVEVVADQDWESHLEAGDSRRGYGNLVVVRTRDDQGNEIDMLYGHMDTVLVQHGQQVSIGTIIGIQGRTGSTTGPHVSVDFFAPGTRSANAASLAMRDRIAEILQSNPDALNQQIQSATPPLPQLPLITELGTLAKIELPKDLRLPSFNSVPALQAEANGIPTSFVSVQTPTGLCSGFAVALDRIVTARHCIHDPDSVTVVDQSGQWLKGVMTASAEDAAIVRVEGAQFSPAQLGTTPPPGAALVTWGHPNGVKVIEQSQLTLQTVNGSTFTAQPAGGAKTIGGFSGGQVQDESGRVVGFNSEANPQGVVKIQSIEVVEKLLNLK
ncbi:trypsin-like peptidase domain-containing protein [Leptolyngbya ohadii]|uniref:trypsin-like peptidase domain-containing protein n=1 Tax=Leptolyngbya ohadii TaxID=1962290 RepID=UPI0015C5C3A4|nr:trypsin-like peptidase domain-containing protein [Leptolyngbya ohadii]